MEEQLENLFGRKDVRCPCLHEKGVEWTKDWNAGLRLGDFTIRNPVSTPALSLIASSLETLR